MPQITLGKYTVAGTNHRELLELKKEIFGESRYFVDIGKPDPTIIDAGAHVGLAALYFKSIWPQAKITCIEPHPDNIRYLRQNLWTNFIDDVTVIDSALAEQVGERHFYFDSSPDQWHSTAGFSEGAWNHTQQSHSIKVKTIPLNDVVTGPVDLLKLDIEGAESQVLAAAYNALPRIHHLLFEYHPTKNNSWHKLISVLNRNNFVSLTKLPVNPPKKLELFHFVNPDF